MDYKKRGKERKLKSLMKKIFHTLKFKSIHLSNAGKITLFGALSLILSLLLPWVINVDKNISWNSFYSISGNIGYILMILFFILMFSLLSIKNKAKLKFYSTISIKNHFLVIMIGFFIISTGVISISFINGLQTFVKGVTHGSGPILSICSGIMIFVGGLLLKNEYSSDHVEIFINKEGEMVEKKVDRNNMKLPF